MSTPDARTRTVRRLPTAVRCAHPVLFALAPLLALYAVNYGEVGLVDLVRPALVLLAVVGALWPVFYRLARRDADRATLALSVCLFVLFLFDSLLPLCEFLRDQIVVTMPSSLLLKWEGDVERIFVQASVGIWAALCIGLICFCLRYGRKEHTGLAWIAAAALVGPSLGHLATAEVARWKSQSLLLVPKAAEGVAGQPTVAPVTSTTPDLYVIVLDAYGRQDILKEIYGVDNTPFLAELSKRGFAIAAHSRANYMQTPLALASALNLDYLGPETSGSDLLGMQTRIDRNRIASLLRTHGYRFISIPTGFPLTATPSADLILDYSVTRYAWATPYATPLEGMLLQKTPLGSLVSLNQGPREQHRGRIVAAFDHLGAAARLPYPKFVFAHILAPHPPFVFDATGGQPPVSATQQNAVFSLDDATEFRGSAQEYHRGYADQLRFINERVLATIDTIRAASRRPIVIVLMGDHGPRCGTDWHSRERTDVHEAFSNLFAVSLSTETGQAAFQRQMEGVITPINGLRLVMNAAFGTDFPTLPNRSFYSTIQKPCDYIEVTSSLDKAR